MELKWNKMKHKRNSLVIKQNLLIMNVKWIHFTHQIKILLKIFKHVALGYFIGI